MNKENNEETSRKRNLRFVREENCEESDEMPFKPRFKKGMLRNKKEE